MTGQRWDDTAAMDEMLSAYLDGDLSAKERESVRVALESDAALHERYRDLAATVALLRDLPTPTPRRSFVLTPEQARAARPDLVIGLHGDTAARPLVAGNMPPAMQPYAAAPAPAALPPMPPMTAMPTRARTAAPPGTPSPANVTPLRPRSPLARLVPLSGALSAVAAVLLIAVLALDFTGGGNRAAAPVSRAVTNTGAIVENPNLTPPPTFAPATTAAGAAGGAGAPSAAAPAAVQVPTAAPQPATVPAPSRSVPATDDGPNALVRVAEIALALLLVAGIAGLLLGLRARQHIPTAG